MTDISYKLKCTLEFQNWIAKQDRSLSLRIDQRIQRLVSGNPGLHRHFNGLFEIKWRTGAIGSFRLYCAKIDGVTILLGGHKDSQEKDIKKARLLLKGVKNGKIRTQVYEQIF